MRLKSLRLLEEVRQAVQDKLPTLHDEVKALLRQGDNEP